MKNLFDIILVGNNVATLVAANELSKKNIDFCVLHSSDFWGGHFSCIKKFGSNFDIGMTLLEFTDFSDSDNPSIKTFNKNIKGDIGRFSSFLKNYVESIIPLSIIDTPKVMYNDSIINDFLISNNLQGIKNLNIFDQMIEELSNEISGQLHPSNKNSSDLFLKQNFDKVSLSNHGKSFHNEIIEKYIKKVINRNTSSIISRFHRQIWLPLYYPESLMALNENIDVFSGQPTLFHYPSEGRVGDITKILKNNILNKCSFYKNDEKKYSIKVANDTHEIIFGDSKISAKEVFWSDNLESINSDITSGYKYDKASIILFFAKIPKDKIQLNFSVLNIINENNFIYRITNQSICSSSNDDLHHVVCEANYDYFKKLNPSSSDEEISNIFIEQLKSMKFLDVDLKVESAFPMVLKNTYMIPSEENYNNYLHQKNYIHKKYPSMYFSGQSNDLFANSLNDQILQGLHFASKF